MTVSPTVLSRDILGRDRLSKSRPGPSRSNISKSLPGPFCVKILSLPRCPWTMNGLLPRFPRTNIPLGLHHGNGFFISSPRNSSGCGAAALKSAARWHSRVRRRQIECHGEIAISTLNRKFALTSDVEPCLITRFKLRGRRKARLSKLTFKKNISSSSRVIYGFCLKLV